MTVNDETTAVLFEDAITALAASDAKLPSMFSAHFLGFVPSFELIKEEQRRYGVCEVDLAAMLQQKVSMVFKNSSSGAFELMTVRKMGYIENQKFCQFRPQVSQAAKKCVVERTDVMPSGSIVNKEPWHFQFDGSRWMPTSDRFIRKTGKTKRVTGFANRGGYWAEFEELEPTLDAWPEIGGLAEFSQRMLWNIRLSAFNAPGILAATDPVGVRELLRMRDVPVGKTRRQALLHWVKEHWRQNRKDEAVEHQVREYLRGSRICSWFGLECQIMPSRVDDAKNKMIPHKAWRSRH